LGQFVSGSRKHSQAFARPKSNCKVKGACDSALSAARDRFARFFKAIKHDLAMATCYEKIARNVRASLPQVCALTCLK